MGWYMRFTGVLSPVDSPPDVSFLGASSLGNDVFNFHRCDFRNFFEASPIEGPDGTDPKKASFERAPPIEGPDGTRHLGIPPGPGQEISWRGDLVS